MSSHQSPDAAPSGLDIALIGIGCHLPGARGPLGFWKNLRAGVESIATYSEEELRAAGVGDSLLKHPDYVRRGAPLEQMEWFDAEFFGLSPKEAAIMDPQHRHFLECAWEALEDAAQVPERFDGRIGVFAGSGMAAYFAFNLLTNPELLDEVGLFLLRHTGNDKDFLATRASYLFNLKGPSVNVQTACSTSLVAVHQAAQSLIAGECDLALAGGVTIELPHRRGYLYKENEILSPTGQVRAFDHRSAGTVFGSGAVVVALKRLDDAVAAGDPIYAVIKGTAVNNDGSGKSGYLAPSVDGQAECVAEALSVAGVSPDTIGYIETHGTGTPIGDPIEIAALTQAFRSQTKQKGFCALGSVKGNIGHLDTAAGGASLIKAALALKFGEIPPSLHFEAPNPDIDFKNSPFFVNASLRTWPSLSGPRRAGVTSLGVGGTNAHAVLEQAPQRSASSTSSAPAQLLVLSAKSRAALDDASAQLASRLRSQPQLDLADVAYTLLHGRKAFGQRRVLAARSLAEAASLLESRDPRRVFQHSAHNQASLVFLFPGGGAPHLDMARDLWEHEPSFRAELERGFALFERRSGQRLAELLYPAAGADRPRLAAELERPALQLPALFLVEMALARWWMAKGLRPEALIGHSLGENTAACLAGVFSFEDALGLVALRGELFEQVPKGGMLSVPLTPQELQPLLGPDLDLATVNAPELCVASGPLEALEALERRLAEREIEAQRIRIHIAAHSRMLEPILAPFRAYLQKIRLSAPKLPIFSNLTGKRLETNEATDPEYWVRHLRSPVRFADGVEALCAVPGRVLLEVGPGKTLSTLSRQHPRLNHTGGAAIASLRHPDEELDDRLALLTAQGRLWAAGLGSEQGLDLAALWAGETRHKLHLPGYAFQRSRFWIEPGRPMEGGRQDETPRIERLGHAEDWFFEARWRERALPVRAADAAVDRGPWLVFEDAGGLGRGIVERLRAAGAEVVRVLEGDAFAQPDERTFILAPEHGQGSYERLARELVAAGRAPRRIVHLWMVTEDEGFRPGSSFFHRNQERGFYSLFFLSRALASEGRAEGVHLLCVSNGMQSVADEGVLYPEKATLLGPLRVAPRELPGFKTASLDIDWPRQQRGWRRGGSDRQSRQAAALAGVWSELAGEPASGTFALRPEKAGWVRYEQAIARSEAPVAGAAASRLRRGGRYLITGGLGGVGLALARDLAKKLAPRLALIARSPLPAREHWDALLRSSAQPEERARVQAVRELEALGAEVLVLTADVTDVVAMRAAMAEIQAQFGGLDGVLHAAGVLADGPMEAKSQADIERVLGPKVHGTLVLEEVLQGQALDFLVLFSSTSVHVAPPGQVDYVAANAFLDAHAARRARDRRRLDLAVGWGVWSEVGMAARLTQPANKQPKAEAQPANNPLFATRKQQRGGRIELEADWSPATHWMLDEHRLASGQALLPGTGYIELLRAALAEVGEKGGFALEDLLFFRPFYVADDATRRLRIALEPSQGGYSASVLSAAAVADGRQGWERHAQCTVALRPLDKLPDVDLVALRSRLNGAHLGPASEGLISDQERHLRFGPRWRVLREVRYGAGEALAELELPRLYHRDLSEHGLHPALLDMATGFAMGLIPGYQPDQGLWVPLGYGRVEVLESLPRRILARARAGQDSKPERGLFSFDIEILDVNGRVLLRALEFTLRRLEQVPNLAQAAAPATEEVEFDAREEQGERRAPTAAELRFAERVALGLKPAEGSEALERLLRSAPSPAVLISTLDLRELVVEAEREAQGPRPRATGTRFARPDLSTEFAAASDDIERSLVGFWQELLGLERVGIDDSFFDLGGHSLIAVRLFAKIKKTFEVDYPISILFEAPTIRACARLIRDSKGGGEAKPDTQRAARRERRYTHLVAMHADEGGPRPPFFLVAGMFGNVMNLRHLAALVGTDRPFYGLQARGLFGDKEPHHTFEEAARDYLAELRTVQPEGPYYLGGFSGGGITAYEMARQLRAEGQSIAALILLDTPLPSRDPISRLDKLSIHWQRIRQQGLSYGYRWIKNRIQWELDQRAKQAGPRGGDQHQFHDEVIEAAFRAALGRYAVTPYPDELTLFRPRLPVVYTLSGGRRANQWREVIFEDNGWSRYCQQVSVHEVPGDHDSMVLEPNVRVLAARLRETLDQAERKHRRSLAS
jgi:acyl transferase domain-containing protein/thioesterase domain-containing protein